MFSLSFVFLASVGVAPAADFDALLSPSGWELRGSTEHDLLGTVQISTKEIQGLTCLQGTALVQARAGTMLAVVEDIDAALSWSRAGLIGTRILGRQGNAIDYYQHLDVPDWTMAADRYWVLRSMVSTAADGAVQFRWDRFDWRSQYPDLAAELDRDHPKAVEPDPNFGAWSFRDGAAGSELRYFLCTESGNLPSWLQKAAATKTVPDAMADVVREARRRDG